MRKFAKIFISILGFIIGIWVGSAAYNLRISDISFANWWWNTISRWWTPDVYVTVQNDWDSDFDASNLPQWFISCIYNNYDVGKTNQITQMHIMKGTSISILVQLDKLLTATSRYAPVNCVISLDSNILHTYTFNLTVSSWWKYSESALDESVSSIRQHLDAAEPNSLMWWWDTVKNFIFNLISNILVPIIVLAWIIMWIIWWYQIVTSDKPEAMKQWVMKVVWWIVWIIFILSAKYIWTVIFNIFAEWNMQGVDSLNWVTFASELYTRIAYPFIKMAIYLVLWVLFLILAGKTISIVTSGDIKKAGTIIAWTAISILAIIWAKQIVEAVYGKQSDVLNKNALNLWDLWSGVLANKSIPLVYDVINWVLWITAVVILILILVHTFKILTNPSKADNRQSLWKSLLYIFIWIMVIWVGYLITNLLIIN